MKTNLEKLLLSIKEMTKETVITEQEQMKLATEMMEYYETQLKIVENEEEAKGLMLQVLENQIEKMSKDI